MIPKQPSLSTLRAVILTLQSVAFVTTAYRLSFRYRTHRIWWDDFWAFVALIFDVVATVGALVFIHKPESHKTHVISFWMMNLGFTAEVWTARISLAVANVRINVYPSPMRRWALALTLFLTAMALFLLGQKTVVCTHKSHWILTPLRNPACNTGLTVAITNVCMDFVADFLLVLVPLKMLWRVKLAVNLRRLIIVLFSASILTTLASIPQAAMQIWVGGSLSALTSEVEAAISLTVCNLLIVVTHFYHIFHHGEDIESAYDYSRRKPLTTLNFADTAAGSNLTSVHFGTEDTPLSTEKSTIPSPNSPLPPQNSAQQAEASV